MIESRIKTLPCLLVNYLSFYFLANITFVCFSNARILDYEFQLKY